MSTASTTEELLEKKDAAPPADRSFGAASHERPVPRISIEAFSEFLDTIAAMQRAASDRRLSKAHVGVQSGGIQAAAQYFSTHATPNLLIVETAGQGQAVREYSTDTGPADYVLFVDGRPVGVIEAKKEGTLLAGVAEHGEGTGLSPLAGWTVLAGVVVGSALVNAVNGESASPTAHYVARGESIDAGNGNACIAVDDVDHLDMVGQLALFDLFNRVRTGRGVLVTAGDRPPVDLPLREDLRTRLGAGAVLRLEPLNGIGRAHV